MEARERVRNDPECIYSRRGHRNNQIVLHELCRLITFPRDNPENDGELSDDDEDEVPDQRPVSDCLQCLENDNKEICSFASYMINISHGMGPTRVSCPPETVGHEERNQEPEEEDRYEVHESILTVTDSLDKTPLHILCEQSVDVDLLRVILSSSRDNNQNPSAPTALELITAKDSRGSTPLHYLAFSRQCPLAALRLMMEYCKPVSNDVANTDPTLCIDLHGDTPLHWALEGYMSPRRVEVLLCHSKASLSVRNATGKVPLDQFVGNFLDAEWKQHDVTAKETWSSIQAYLRIFDDRNDENNNEDWMPLHMLASSPIDFPAIIYDMAIYYCRDDTRKLDSQGRLPLHLACARTNKVAMEPSNNIFAHKLVAEHPRATYTATTRCRRLPIHFAVEARQTIKLIAALLKAYPNSLNVKDPKTGLWPFLLAACHDERTVDTSYSLLRADPSIVQLAISALTSKGGQQMDDDFEDHSNRRLRRLKIR